MRVRHLLTEVLAPLAYATFWSSALVAQASRPQMCVGARGSPQPVIDVHMHAVGSDTAVLNAVRNELTANNVVAVVLSSLASTRTLSWAAQDRRFIASIAFREASIPVDSVRHFLERGTFRAIGELGFQYAGLSPSDPSLEPYFALAEELDVPVAIHMAGGGLPNEPRFRVRLGDPLLLEDVIIRHPKLRVNVMHAGLPFAESLLALMRRYPQVYADLSKISDGTAYPRKQFHDYLRTLINADLGKRLMYGSDAAGEGAERPSIEGITSADFLNDEQRRDILCDNAARFYRLSSVR